MNMTAVNRTIRVLCAEVRKNDQGVRDWNRHTEEELLHEACVCIFSSQMMFEVAEAAAEQIRNRGLLRLSRCKGSGAKYEKCLRAALSEPLAIERDGKVLHVRPRFPNRLALLLATTVTTMRDQGQSLRKILFSARSAREAREILVKQVWGFGPKQASLFLRPRRVLRPARRTGHPHPRLPAPSAGD